MVASTNITISKSLLNWAAELARRCSSTIAKERTLVSQSVALAVREHIEKTYGIVTEDGRSGSVNYIELLDICDFKAGNWDIEVRTVTGVDQVALYVPTMPLMVGVLSDFYICAQVEPSLTGAEIFGYATRADLAEAELSANGMFAILPLENLSPLDRLAEELKGDRKVDPDTFRVYGEWQSRADRIIQGIHDLLAHEGAFKPEQMEQIAAGVWDDIFRIYGEHLPQTGLEPLFEQLFRRFGIDRSIPSAPASSVAFKNRAEDQSKFKRSNAREEFFYDNLNVKERVSLYRYLLEDEAAVEEHRRMTRVLDQATGGKQNASPRRRANARSSHERRARSSWTEPPIRRVTTKVGGQAGAEKGERMAQPGRELGLDQLQLNVGKRIEMPGHFAQPVVLEEIRPLPSGYDCRVRLSNGSLEETSITEEEAQAIFGAAPTTEQQISPVDAEQLRLFVESARIRLAYAYDQQFAVSLSGIRTLPHQIEAVYMKMLPQPRLRFLLADDPGAGKTIMAGLLIKEMKLRQAIERVLILCPAPLTIQWQDELFRWFGEEFDIVSSSTDQHQIINPWQRFSQVIASIDYAKQETVRERVWQQRWDMVIIDEAHKCSAYTKQASHRAPQAGKTMRYELAEKLTAPPDQNVLLLTATPHHGDEDRFGHFLRLVDPDLFPEPHKLQSKAAEIRKNILKLGHDCPWALRRLKEDLRDFEGRRLFPDRHTKTVEFKLNADEYALYKAVTSYINQYLPQAGGRQKASVALARTVLQRRLASSTWAIYESLKRRFERQRKLLEELESLSPAQQARRLAQLQGRLIDTEQDEDDLDEEQRDQIADGFTTAMALDSLQEEIVVLGDLIEQARAVRDNASDSKLAALKGCLKQAEFQELKDGRGKLLIFTEHRDTLNYLRNHLVQWGYTVCEIHGGMNVHQRKTAQEEFRTTAQICVATEAAGEGINLQFCHLMINYDMPWNPTRLEQRLGRIHRIGQTRDVYCFNYVATESEDGAPIIEGRILQRLLSKLEEMKDALEGRVYDVIGEVLSINDVNLPAMIQEATLNPGRLEEKLDDIERIDPDQWRKYEEATGIALARDRFDHNRFQRFQEKNFEIEERRLMPKYIEEQFKAAAKVVGLRIEERADGLLRMEHVPQDLRSDRWESIKRLGKPETTYRKVTFHKEVLERDQHVDAVLAGPGHPLYAVVDESLNFKLANLAGQVGFYVDPLATSPYRIHFFEMIIRGETLPDQNSRGKKDELYAELVAIREEDGQYERIPADIIIDLPSHPSPPVSINSIDVQGAADYLKSTYHIEKRAERQKDRQHFVEVCRKYLAESFTARINATQERVMGLMARERAEPDVTLARANAERDLDELNRLRADRLARLDRLAIARTGPVRHLATAIVVSAEDSVESQLLQLAGEENTDARRASELAAEDCVIEHEAKYGWRCERVGHMKIGFDIRSTGPADPASGQRDVRRIEVKGRRRGEPIRLTTNEWYVANQLGPTYWLYVVYDPTSPNRELFKINDPAKVLDHAKREIITARMFELGADAVVEAAGKCEEIRKE